ncbi:MAG: hypothetical protein QOK10_435 [Pseudonocardiales bacterium]|jgi:hypothetical protein|nr:hypothetical protein [Pseudonocardiales bacterium]
MSNASMSNASMAELDRPEARSAQRARRSWAGAAGWFLLLVAVALWLTALGRTDVSDLGQWGLVAAFPVTFYVAVAIVVASCAANLTARVVSERRLAASLVILVAMLYASATLVERVPRLPWVYKHIAVTSFIELHGSVDTSIDIYNRWPGFFALSAYLGDLTGYHSPLSYAAWAEPVFALFDALLVLAIARAFSRDARWYWGAAVLFSVTNWIGQNYYSPQAFAFSLYLSVVLIAVLLLRHVPRRLGRSIETVIARLARYRGSTEDGPEVASPRAVRGRGAAAAVAAILLIQLVIVISHQLTPYLLVVAVLPLGLLGYLRPSWLGVVAAVLTLAYLVPNYSYVQQHFGLFSGFDPFANATYQPPRSQSLPAGLWQSRGTQALTALMWLFTVVGLIRRIRHGYVRDAVVVGWLAIAPAMSLLSQSYGGEGRLRVLLFALPWNALAACWMLWPSSEPRTARASAQVPAPRTSGHPRTVAAAAIGVVAVMALIFVPTYFQPEADYQVTAADVSAGQWLDDHVSPGDHLLVTAPNFPTPGGAHYNFTYNSTGVLSDFTKYHNGAMTLADLRAAAASFGAAGHPSFVVFSRQQDRYAAAHALYAPGELESLEQQLSRDPGAAKVYDEQSTRIYELR